MTDREKVIKGLKLCSDVFLRCEQCPYFNEIDPPYCNELKKDALALLMKEHEVVVPLTIDDAVSELMDKHYKRLKEYEAKLLTFDEVKKHFLVPKELFGSIEEYIDYANDIEPLYMECRIEDAFVCHWRTHENISMHLDEWKNEYGKTWRCWTKKPTQEQKNEVKWNERPV